MFKTANKDTSPPSSVPTSTSPGSSLSSKAGKLRVTPEGGLSLVGDGGVLGKVSTSSPQQGQKQKFFATRSADGKWNLLMAPSSDPSRLFLVQPAPGHKFQVESLADGSSSGKPTASSSNGCETEQQPPSVSSPESSEHAPGTPKSVAVSVAQVLSSSSSSPLSSPQTTTATTPTNVETTTTSSDAAHTCNTPEQKKPSFFKSRTAGDREVLKAQQLAGKKVLAVAKKSNKSASHSSKKGKNSSKSTGTPRSHKKNSTLPTPVQESMSECFSQMSVSPGKASPETTFATATTSTTSLTGVTTTISSSVTSSTSTSHSSTTSSPGTSNVRMTPAIDHNVFSSPSGSPLHHAASDISLSTSPHSMDPAISPAAPRNSVSPSRTSSMDGDGHDGLSVPYSDAEMSVSRGKPSTSTICEDGEPVTSPPSVEEDVSVDVTSSAEKLPTEPEEELATSLGECDNSKTITNCNQDADHGTLDNDLSVSEPCTVTHEHRPYLEDDSSKNEACARRIDDADTDHVHGNGNENSSVQEDHITKEYKETFSRKPSDSHVSQSTTEEYEYSVEISDKMQSGRTDFYKGTDSLKHAQVPPDMSLLAEGVMETVAEASVCKRRKTAENVTFHNSSDTDDYEFAVSDSDSETRKRSSVEESKKDSADVCVDEVTGKGCGIEHDVPESGPTPDRQTHRSQTSSKKGKNTTKRKTPSRKLTRNRGHSTEYNSAQSPVSQSTLSEEDQSGLDTNDGVDTTCQSQLSNRDEEQHKTRDEGETTVDPSDKVSSCQTASNTDRSDRIYSQESEIITAESSQQSSKEVDNVSPCIVASNQQSRIKKRAKKKKSELDALLEMNNLDKSKEVMEFSRHSRTNPDVLNPWSVSFTEESKPKKRRKRLSEVEALMETQKAGTEKDSEIVLDTSHQEPSVLDALEETADIRCSFQVPEPNAAEMSISESTELNAMTNKQKKQKKKKKKKQQLKILINLTEANAKDITSTDHASEQSDTLPSTDTVSMAGHEHTVPKESTEPEEIQKQLVEQTTLEGVDKQSTIGCSISERLNNTFPGDTATVNLKKTKKKKKKKKQKLKIIFGSGQETSTREIPVCTSPQSSAWNAPENVPEAIAAESIETRTQTSEGPDSIEKNQSDPSKKKRKKRLTELETLIHDQECLSRQELSTNKESAEVVAAEDDSASIHVITEVDTSKQAETNEADGLGAPKSSDVKEKDKSENGENNSSIPSHDIVNTDIGQQQTSDHVYAVVNKDGKSKEKKKKKKKKKIQKTPTAGVIIMPPWEPGTSNDATEPEANHADVTRTTEIMAGDGEGSDSALCLVTPDSEPLLEDTDEEDDVASSNRAMAKFLTSRSFTKWELAGMFGTPFVVLERISDQDVYFMSRRFRNARVSSRTRCSNHCRTRTLDFLCELKLIDCRIPAEYRQVMHDAARKETEDSSSKQPTNDEPPKKKKRKRNNKEEKEDGSQKKKSKSADKDQNDAGEKANSDNIILINESEKTSTSQASKKPAILTKKYPSFPSATFGRLPTVRVSPAPGKSNIILTSVSPPTTSVGSRVITIPSLGTSGMTSLPQVITIPPLHASNRASSLPQVITIPSMGASSSSLREATRASLAQAISNSLTKARPVIAISTTSPTVTSSSPVVSTQLKTASLLPVGPIVIQGTGTSSTVTTTTTSAGLPKQFYVVQMGDKRVLVPAAALCSTSTTSTVTTSLSTATTVTAPSGASLQSLVNTGVQRPTVTVPTVITTPATSVCANAPVSLTPGSVARIVLSNCRTSALTPRVGPTASTLLFASRPGAARPNLPWTGPRTVDNNRRLVVTPANQPQGIRVVLSGAGPASTRTRFSVASSRSGVFVTSRQPTSLVRAAQPGQSRPGKRVMTEEERLRKRARLEKKYPLPPGVVIKTEPSTQGYGDEGKSVQAVSAGTRVYVSKVPGGLGGSHAISLNQPIPVLSALRGGPLVIRQAAPVGVQRASSLLAPLIIRMPNSATITGSTASSASSSSTITTVAAAPAVSLLSSPTSHLPSTVVSASSLTFSLLNTTSSRTKVTSSSASTTATVSATSGSRLPLPVPGTVSATATHPSPHVTISTPVSVALSASNSSGAVSNAPQINDDDDDAIYIADSPPPETPDPAEKDPPSAHTVAETPASSTPDEQDTAVSTVDSPAVSSPTPSVPGPAVTSAAPSTAPSVSSPITTLVTVSPSPSVSSSTSSSPTPRSSTPILPSRMASLGAMWVRQAAGSSGSVPSINASSLQSERMRRLKETLSKQMEGLGDERRQKALHALHQRFFRAAQGSAQKLVSSSSSAVSSARPSTSTGGTEDDGSSPHGHNKQPAATTAERTLEDEREEGTESRAARADENDDIVESDTDRREVQETTEAIVIHEDSDDGVRDTAAARDEGGDTTILADSEGDTSTADTSFLSRGTRKQRTEVHEDSNYEVTDSVADTSFEDRGGREERAEVREDSAAAEGVVEGTEEGSNLETCRDSEDKESSVQGNSDGSGDAQRTDGMETERRDSAGESTVETDVVQKSTSEKGSEEVMSVEQAPEEGRDTNSDIDNYGDTHITDSATGHDVVDNRVSDCVTDAGDERSVTISDSANAGTTAVTVVDGEIADDDGVTATPSESSNTAADC